MKNEVRIAARLAATEITAEDMEKATGGMMATGTVRNTSDSCQLDQTTDCWIEGGRFVYNDDAS